MDRAALSAVERLASLGIAGAMLLKARRLAYLLTRWLVVIAFPIALYALVPRFCYPKRRVTPTGMLIAAAIGVLLVVNSGRR